MVGDLKSLGWTVMLIGVVQVVADFGDLARNQLARQVGVAAVALNAVAQLLLIPAIPRWSLTMFTSTPS